MEAETLYKLVKENSSAILLDADNGDGDAKAIETAYNLLVRHFDNCALGILEGAFEKWCEKRNIQIKAQS